MRNPLSYGHNPLADLNDMSVTQTGIYAPKQRIYLVTYFDSLPDWPKVEQDVANSIIHVAASAKPPSNVEVHYDDWQIVFDL